MKRGNSSWERCTLTSGYSVLFRGRRVTLLPTHRAKPWSSSRKRRSGSPQPRLAAATRCSSSPSICSPFPSSSSSSLQKPGAGMGSPPLPHASSRAENLWLWPGSQAPSAGGEQSHRRACSLLLFHPAPGEVRSPRDASSTSLEALALPLGPRRAREGGGREVPGVPENSARLQKEDVKIIKHR